MRLNEAKRQQQSSVQRTQLVPTSGSLPKHDIKPDHAIFEERQEDEAAYTMEEIKEAIFQLSDGYRTILSLLLLEGYDHEEVSEILEISNVTSRTQLSRAKQQLRNLLVEKRVKQLKFAQHGQIG